MARMHLAFADLALRTDAARGETVRGKRKETRLRPALAPIGMSRAWGPVAAVEPGAAMQRDDRAVRAWRRRRIEPTLERRPAFAGKGHALRRRLGDGAEHDKSDEAGGETADHRARSLSCGRLQIIGALARSR